MVTFILHCIVKPAEKLGNPDESRVSSPNSPIYCTVLHCTVLYSPIYIHCPWQCSSAAECWLAARPALARWSAQQQSVCGQRSVWAEAAEAEELHHVQGAGRHEGHLLRGPGGAQEAVQPGQYIL